MRLGKVVLIGLLGISVFAHAQYDENVMLDLSVLDGLGSGNIVVEEPLFPILPKEKPQVKPRKKINKVKKAPAKQQKEAVKKVEEQTQETVMPQKTTAKEEVVVVEREPSPSEALIDPVEVEPSFSAPKIENDVKPEQNTIENDKTSLMQEAQPSVVQESSSSNEANAGLLVEESPKEENNKLFSLTFAPDADELTPDQMSAIDSIVSSFKNEKTNKIAIYSYNLDDGIDSFRKKRISLNRALAVRTYLIRKEYKNFSIKVINISGNSPKLNMVELEEI